MSWIEVEAKVKVDNVKATREKIKKIAIFVGKEHKEDTYYTFKSKKGYPEERFRVRKVKKKYVLNFKRRGKPSKIQAKEEFELMISDFNAFKAFLSEFGFKPFVYKIKDSEIYKYHGLHIELNKVKGLGWFIEIEVLCPKKFVANARKKINKVLKILDIKDKDIETRGYSRMLWEQGLLK